MTLHGIGTDLVEIARLEANKEAFATRILTASEQRVMQSRPASAQLPYLAKRWAAKEAAAKALGCGIGKSLSFHDIETSHNEAGAPLITIARYPEYCFLLSLSDTSTHALAMVTAEKVA